MQAVLAEAMLDRRPSQNHSLKNPYQSLPSIHASHYCNGSNDVGEVVQHLAPLSEKASSFLHRRDVGLGR